MDGVDWCRALSLVSWLHVSSCFPRPAGFDASTFNANGHQRVKPSFSLLVTVLMSVGYGLGS